jgi:GNAT superfamily N-acetyltransferase
MNGLPKDSLFYNGHYREKALLKDGTEVELRLVIPADKTLLAHGMDNFSPESRYQRFLGAKKTLDDNELTYLTHVDGVDHFAIGALASDEEGIGVARFVRFGPDRSAAEAAIAVLDAYQNRGLGRILFTRMISAAVERGIEHLNGSMLSDNRSMKGLLDSIGLDVRYRLRGPVTDFEVTLEGRTDRP